MGCQEEKRDRMTVDRDGGFPATPLAEASPERIQHDLCAAVGHRSSPFLLSAEHAHLAERGVIVVDAKSAFVRAWGMMAEVIDLADDALQRHEAADHGLPSPKTGEPIDLIWHVMP